MTQKKIIIWSLVIGFTVSLVLYYFSGFPCNVAKNFLQIFDIIELVINLASAQLPTPYPGYGGTIPDFGNCVRYVDSDLNLLKILFINFLFWSFIAWLVLTGIRKLRENKNINIQNQGDKVKF